MAYGACLSVGGSTSGPRPLLGAVKGWRVEPSKAGKAGTPHVREGQMDAMRAAVLLLAEMAVGPPAAL